MEGEEAMNVFLELMKAKPDLQKMDTKDLGKIRFAGPAAVSFMGRYIKRLEQKGLGEQREEALKDGEDIAAIIIENEAEIGRRYDSLPQERVDKYSGTRVREAEGIKTKEAFREELKLSQNEASRASEISKHPEVVKEVLAAAKVEKELPTRERIHRTIREKAEAERPKQAPGQFVTTVEQKKYLDILDGIILMLPSKPPKDWQEEALLQARKRAHIITKRLEVFNEQGIKVLPE